MDFLAVTRDDLGEGERERPLQIDAQLRRGSAGKFQHVAAALTADRRFGNQNLAGSDKESTAAQYVEDALPTFFIPRDAVKLDLVDVHVSLQRVRVADH